MLFWPDVHEREANDESQNTRRPEGAVNEMLARRGAVVDVSVWAGRHAGNDEVGCRCGLDAMRCFASRRLA